MRSSKSKSPWIIAYLGTVLVSGSVSAEPLYTPNSPLYDEVGLRGSFTMRTWVSNVEMDTRINGNDVVEATGITSAAVEVDYRLEDKTRTYFIKSVVGGGGNYDGQFNFVGAPSEKMEASYFGYLSVDAGWNAVRTRHLTLSPFVGYQMLYDRFETGIDERFTLYQKTHWHALRLGVAAKGQITNRLGWHGELNAIPYAYNETVSIDSDNGYGFQGQAFLTYDVSDRWSVGVGGRHWWMKATGRDNGTENEIAYRRTGALVEGTYHF